MPAMDWFNEAFEQPEKDKKANGYQASSGDASPNVSQMPTLLFGKSSEQGKSSAAQSATGKQKESRRRYKGIVKSFNFLEGFGFISCDDGKDVYVHASKFNGAQVRDAVSFAYRKKLHKGAPQAQDVIVLEQPQAAPAEQQPCEQQAKDLRAPRYHGTLKSFYDSKGFGFINCPEASDQHDRKDIFVHAKALNGAVVGNIVSFTCALRKGAPQAQDVVVVESIPDEKPLRNSRRSSDSRWNRSGKDAKKGVMVEKEHMPTRGKNFEKKFDPYLCEEDIKEGLSNGTLVRGELRMSDRQTLAFVKPEKAGKDDLGKSDYCIRGKLYRNRAIHGDVVIIKLLEEGEDSEGGRNTKHNKPPRGSSSSRRDAEDEENQEDDLAPIHAPAKVVAIADFKGRNRVLTCTLHSNTKSSNGENPSEGMVLEGDKTIKAIPFDKRLPWILIQINDTTKKILRIPGKLDKYKYWPVKIQGWDEYSILPIGLLKGESFGEVGCLQAEVKAALCESELDSHDVDFEDDVMDEAENIVVQANLDFENEVSRRMDLRKKRICTIDPATAKDLDDAIHIDIVGRQAEIGVHIADVGHFLKVGCATDTEAQRKTTSVYLTDRVLPMLPHSLCNHLCSLNPNEEKLAFSAFFRLDLDTGKLVDDPPPRFAKTVIKSCCRMAYEEVQDVLDGNPLDPPQTFGGHSWESVTQDLFKLYDVCGKVRRNRFEGEDGQGGALSVTKVQMVFHTRESEDGIPTGYHLEEHSASHWIIEELMLMANKVVARYIAASPLSDVAVLRNHQAPDPKKAEKLSKLLLALGIDWWDASTAGKLHASLARVKREHGETLGICVETMAMINGMQQATYFPVGNGEPCQHYALDFDHYTHFTSPIRRYPDVMVHRVLDAVLCQAEAPVDLEGTERLCTASNEKKKSCRQCKDLLDRAVFCCYLRAQKNWFYTVGTVLLIKKDEMSVYCPQLGKEKSISFHYANAPDPENPDARLRPPPTLFTAGVDDELMLPESLERKTISHVKVNWVNPVDRSDKKTQHLRLLSNVPIVIIPTDTVPIDFAMFLVSPFHRHYESVSEKEARGFECRDDDLKGVEAMWSAPHRRHDYGDR